MMGGRTTGENRTGGTLIHLYRRLVDPQADQIEAELKRLSLAYTRELKNKVDVFIEEDGKKYKTMNEMYDFVKEMESYKSEWEKFQSDSCYIEDDGSVC